MTAEGVNAVSPAPVDAPSHATPGNLARDIFALFVRPASLFRELPRTNRVAGALLLLMSVHALYGLGLISTGVLDYEIDVDTQGEISRIRQHPPAKESAEKFTAALDAVEKGAIFKKQLTRVLVLAGGPLQVCVDACVLAGCLFLIVALRGGKPNFRVLLGVTTFAAFVEVPRLLMRLFLTTQLQVSRVETSAAVFASRPEVGLGPYLLLRRLDPFEVWYYLLVGFGVVFAGQLKPRAAAVAVFVLALLAAPLHMSRDLQELAEMTSVSFGNR
jgi:hypothetical protein